MGREIMGREVSRRSHVPILQSRADTAIMDDTAIMADTAIMGREVSRQLRAAGEPARLHHGSRGLALGSIGTAKGEGVRLHVRVRVRVRVRARAYAAGA